MKLFKNKKANTKWIDPYINKIKQHPWSWFLIIEALFIAVSIVCFLPYMEYGHMQWSGDNIFHWQRIFETSRDFKHGIWPQFNQFTSYRGIGDETFYPWLTWLPMTIMAMIHLQPVAILSVYPMLCLFAGLNIAYYACYSFTKSRTKSIFFSTFYCISFAMTSAWIVQGENAEFLSVMFLPLVLFGWLHTMNDNHYRMMTTGLALMLFTHLLSTVLATVMLAVLTLISLSRLDKRKIIQFCKAGIIFLFLTAMVWLPIVVLMKCNSIWTPELKDQMSSDAVAIPTTIRQADKGFQCFYDIAIVVAIVIGALRWKKLGYYAKRIYAFGMLVWCFNIQWLPWHFLEHTFIGTLQFPFRTAYIMRVCLLFVLAEAITMNWNTKADKISRTTFAILSAFVAIFLSVEIQGTMKISYHVNTAMPRFSLNDIFGVPRKYLNNWNALGRYIKSNQAKIGLNSGMPEITNNEWKSKRLIQFTTNPDYAQKKYIENAGTGDKAMKIANSSGRPNRTPPKRLSLKQPKRSVNASAKWIHGNDLQITSYSYNKSIALPIMMYHGQSYRFYINGRCRHLKHDKNMKPLVHNVPKGKFVFSYRTPTMWYRYVSFIMSITGLFTISYPDLHRKLKARKRYNVKAR